MTRSLTPDNNTIERTEWRWQDTLLIFAIIAILLVIIRTASNFVGAYEPAVKISTDLSSLPSYTLQTLLRMIIAYFLSLGFTLIYAYSAYQSSLAAKILLPLLDILQSIPVLSFLPGVVLALISLFPDQRLGVELAAILLIFTGMVWNMTFSFYQSLTSIPRDLMEAAQVYRLNLWQRFWTLELPAGMIGLIWNSVMSVAGGWFFLIAIESFTLGDKDFRLPGLGSFLATAAGQGNTKAILGGLFVLIGIIILIDFLIWQPLIAWSDRFKFEMSESEDVPNSWVLDFIRRSPTLRLLSDRILKPLAQNFDQNLVKLLGLSPVHSRQRSPISQGIERVFMGGFAFMVLWGTWEAALLLKTLGLEAWKQIMAGAIFTALRVIVALILSLLWTVPIGVAIGRNPRLAKVLQPIVQIAASVPATALFPILLLFLAQLGGGLEIGSVALMMLGTMWYILFNVIAGAQSIPSDLFEVAKVYHLSLVQRWRVVILPSIFPYLITGIITAVGGAWNASIVSEYVHFQGKTLTTNGLGSTISLATARGDYPVLLAATAVMSLLVVLTNRLVWRRLYKLAMEKYRLL
jgi:NitT/TauT family transport system permease protein